MGINIRSLLLVCSLIITYSHISAQETDSTINRLLGMDLEQLMNVTFTSAGKQPEKATEIPASVVLITRNDIKTSGYTSLSQILENIPGMFLVNDYYFIGSAIGVRGFCPSSDNHNMIFLINGINQVNDLTSSYHFTSTIVPVEAIDRIEVVRGPMSVVYGSGASYGVINIVTNETHTSEISASAGSFKTGKAFGRAAILQNGFNCTVNASVFDTKSNGEAFSKLSSTPPDAYGLKSDYSTRGKLANNEKYIDIFCTYKSLSFGLSKNESSPGGYYFVPSPTGNKTFVNKSIAFVEYKNQIKKQVSFDGKLTFSSNSNYYNLNSLFDDFYGNQHNQTHSLEGEFNMFIKPTKQFEVSTGVFVHSILDSYNSFDLPSYNIPSFSNQYIYLKEGDLITTRSVFVQTNYQPIYNLKFVAGCRLEQMPAYRFGLINADTIGAFVHFPRTELKYSDTKIAFIPRLAAIWSLTDRNILKLMYGKAINRPSFFQTSSYSLNPNASQLKPEWITTYELNFTSFITENIVLTAGVFYNQLNNLIVRVSKQDTETGAFVTWFGNSGTMNTKGTEITLQVNPLKQLRIEASGTYQDTKDERPEFKNKDVSYSPKILGYGKVSYSLNQNASLGLTANYVGAMSPFYDETINNKNGSFGARIGEDVKGYFLLGFNARIEDLFGRGYYANLRFNNLLNQEVRYPTTTNNSWAEKGYIGAGFNFLVSVGKKF